MGESIGVIEVFPGAALREAFVSCDYTVESVVAAIGPEAHQALGRNTTVPARRALAGRRDPLATLVALWLLQQPVLRTDCTAALPGLIDPLFAAGLLTADGEQVRAVVDIRPYGSDDGPWWIASDLTPNLDSMVSPIRPDFVLGVSSASSTLAQLAIRRPARRALDLGTGCGVQSLHLSRHAAQVVATDINARALRLAQLTFAVNGVTVELRAGSAYQPVAEEQFDLIVSNPPYVMAPPAPDRARLAYRESSWSADGLVEHLVRDGAERLVEGGTLQILGNWAHLAGQDWAERLAGWIRPTGCDAHVVQRETLDPASYVELWLADAGLTGSADYQRRYTEWLDYFDALQVVAVGLGWLSLHKAGADHPAVRIEDWPYEVEQPIGPVLAAEQLAVQRNRTLTDADLLRGTWRVGGDVVEELVGPPGAADPERIVCRQQRGFRRAVGLDTALAAVVGACDGELPLGRIIEVVAEMLGLAAADLVVAVLPRWRELAIDGFIRPYPEAAGSLRSAAT